MPKDFTGFFAKRLNDYCKLEVSEAKVGDEKSNPERIIAPSGYQNKIRRVGKSLLIEVSGES